MERRPLSSQSPAPQVEQVAPVWTPPAPQPAAPRISAPPVQKLTFEPPATLTAKTERHPPAWVTTKLKLLTAGLVGLLLAGWYFYLWDGRGLAQRGIIATAHFSPIILGQTAVTCLLLVLVYGLLLRYVYRSHWAWGQAVVTIVGVQLLVICLLALKYHNGAGLNVLTGPLSLYTLLAGLIGGAWGLALAGSAERSWHWRFMPVALAASLLLLLVVGSSGLSRSFTYQLAASVQQQTTVASHVQRESQAGEYNFQADYPQYALSKAMQNRFQLVSIDATNLTTTTSQQRSPHFTHFVLKDRQYAGSNANASLSLWQSQSSSTYNPPSTCGHPNPSLDYYTRDSRVYQASCLKLKDLPGGGTLYGRNQFKSDLPEPDELAAGTYDWYYLQKDDTLLAVEAYKTLTANDIASLLAGLTPTTADALLAQSQALVASNSPR